LQLIILQLLPLMQHDEAAVACATGAACAARTRGVPLGGWEGFGLYFVSCIKFNNI